VLQAHQATPNLRFADDLRAKAGDRTFSPGNGLFWDWQTFGLVLKSRNDIQTKALCRTVCLGTKA
jgi:hypothetical protein